MDYNELTKDQREYLDGLNDTRAYLISAAFEVQQRVADLLGTLFALGTPREAVWRASKRPESVMALPDMLRDAHENLQAQVGTLSDLASFAETKAFDFRYRLRELDPTVWKSRLNGSEEQPEPTND